MNDIPREQLKQLIGRYGRSLAEDPKRCEALLRDFCGQYRKEINVLVSAVKESIPVDLDNSQHRVPSDLLLAQLTKRLEDRLAIDPVAARWSVESWAIALGLISETRSVVEPANNPPPPTSPPTQSVKNNPPPTQPVENNSPPIQPVKNNPPPPNSPPTQPAKNNPPPPNSPPTQPVKNNLPLNPPPTQPVVKNEKKSNFFKLIIPAIVFAFIGYAVVKQAHPDSATFDNSAPESSSTQLEAACQATANFSACQIYHKMWCQLGAQRLPADKYRAVCNLFALSRSNPGYYQQLITANKSCLEGDRSACNWLKQSGLD